MEKIKELIVSECSAEVFEVNEGQRFRVIAHEGAQVSDLVFINAQDKTDTYTAYHTIAVNQEKGIGDFSYVTELYSRAPNNNLLATVTDDTINSQTPWCEDGCARILLEERGFDHDGCSENLLSSLNKYGYNYSKCPNVFNFGMNLNIDALPKIEFTSPTFTKGDYIEFEAEMDLVLCLSACPARARYNEFDPKGLKIVIYE